MFVNEKKAIPTFLGQYIFREINGTILAALQANLNYNSSHFDLQLMPSLAIEMSKREGLNRFDFIGGSDRSVSKLFFSTVIDLKARIDNNRIYELQFNLPKTKHSILSLESSYEYRNKNGVEFPDNNNQTDANKRCIDWANIFGISLCFQKITSYSLNKTELTFTKLNKRVNSIAVSLQRPAINESESNFWKLLLYTPDSQSNRKIEFEFQIPVSLDSHNSAQLKLFTPRENITASMSAINDNTSRRLFLDISINGLTKYRVEIGLESEQKDQIKEFKPRIKVKTLSANEKFSFDGTITVMYDQYRDYWNRTNRLQRHIYGNELDSQVIDNHESKGFQLNMDFNLKVFQIDARIRAFVNNSSTDRQTGNIIVEYNPDLNENFQLIIIREKSADIPMKSLQLLFTSSQFPEFNWKTNFMYAIIPYYSAEQGVYKTFFESKLNFYFYWSRDLSEELHIQFHNSFLESFLVKTELSPTKLWSVWKRRKRFYDIEISVRDKSKNLQKLKTNLYIEMPSIGTEVIKSRITTQLNTYIISAKFNGSPLNSLVMPTNEMTISIDMVSIDNSTSTRLFNSTLKVENETNSINFVADYNWRSSRQRMAFAFRVSMKPSITALTALESTQFAALNAKFLYNTTSVSNWIVDGVAISEDMSEEEIGSRAVRNQILTDHELLIAWNRDLVHRFQYKRHFEYESLFIDRLFFNYDSVHRISIIATPLKLHHELVNVINENTFCGRQLSFKTLIAKLDKTGRHGGSVYSVAIAVYLSDTDLTSGSVNVSANYSGREMVYRQKWRLVGDNQCEAIVYGQWESGRYVHINVDTNLVRREFDNELRVNNIIQYRRWDQIESKEVRGFLIIQRTGTTTTRVRFNYESEDNQFVTGMEDRRMFGANYTDTYEVSVRIPDLLVMKITGGTKCEHNYQVLVEQLFEYRWRNGNKETMSFFYQTITPNRVANGVQHINFTIKNELQSTQWPEYGYSVDYGLNYAAVEDLMDLNVTYGVCWGVNVERNRVRMGYSAFNDHFGGQTMKEQLWTLHSPLVNVDHEFKIIKTESLGESVANWTVTDRRTNLPPQRMIMSVNTRKENYTAVYEVELHCPATNWSHRTNVTINVDTDRDYVELFIVKSRTINRKSNETYAIDIEVSEDGDDEDVIAVRFPKFNASLTEILVDDVYRMKAEIFGGEKSGPYGHTSRGVYNRKTGNLAINFKTSMFFKHPIQIRSGHFYEADVEYEPRKRGVIVVRVLPTLHLSAMTVENWPSFGFTSNISKSDQNFFTVNFPLI